MKKSLRCLLVPAVAAACALPVAADAAVDIFLKIDGIPGESTSQKDQIDVLAWSWGMAQTQQQGAGARPVVRGCISDLHLTKQVDKASPKLMGAVVNGTVLKNAKLSLRRSGEVQQEFMTIEMENVYVSSLQDSGSSEAPYESLSLRFAKATVTYVQQKPDGSAGEKIPVVLQAQPC